MGRFRFAVIILPVAFCYGALLFRLYDLQIEKTDYYVQKAQAQVVANGSLTPERGVIYFEDKDGNRVPAATNKEYPLIFAVPKDIGDVSETAQTLGQMLGIAPEDLSVQLSDTATQFKPIAKRVSDAVAKEVQNSELKGVYIDRQFERFYPFNAVASHLLGYVGPKSNSTGEKGYYGVEEFYNSELSGTSGRFEKNKLVPAEPGQDLVLTIDPNIQVEAERLVSDLVSRFHAKGGGVMVMDPKTGRILTLAGFPDFDPNNYSESPVKHFLDPMVQEIYEPGSVFKVITMAIGIDAGKITPETTYVDKGRLTLNGRTISNYDLKTHGPYGRATMTNVIEHSINTGAVFAEQQIGRSIFTDYLTKFGFGEKTGITLPGELKGDLRNLTPKSRDIAFATASYGQGVAVTPIELLRAMGAIANNGVMMRPTILASDTPKEVRRVITPDTAKQVTDMMVSAVDTAEVARVNGYTLAGKTGTAFVPDFKNGGYTDNVINTYVGYGPASDARFIILIKLNEPEGAPVAALTVVPAFRELSEFILNYYNVPPDRIENH